MEVNVPTEVTFYQDAYVTVTQSRYVTNSKTYAMRNISSVYTFEIIKSRRLPGLLIVAGALLLLAPGARVAAVCILALGIAVLLATKNEFAVRISTNAGESNSLISKDRGYVEKIVDALNQAIIHRG